MKKLIIVIIVLIIIFMGMIIYQSTNSKNQAVTIEKVEEYIDKIYMWKEITKEALPTFEKIEDAPEEWIWEVIKKNSEESEISSEQIQNIAKEIFGKEFNKQFPQEGTSTLKLNEETGKYEATGVDLDQEADLFLLNKIEKIENGYQVQIVEYLEDDTQENVIIKNLKEEEIGKISGSSEDEEVKLVKENIDKLDIKNLILKKENDTLYVEKVWR